MVSKVVVIDVTGFVVVFDVTEFVVVFVSGLFVGNGAFYMN